LATSAVRSLREDDRAWVTQWLREQWGGPTIVTRGKSHRADTLPGFAAVRGDTAVGLITYRIEDLQCEIVSLDSRVEGAGIGTALLDAVADAARQAGCIRLWLITTNDNTRALRFYQRRGFVLAAIHRDAIAESRRIKPSISQIGIDGIPIRDEIELEMKLGHGHATRAPSNG